MAAEQGPLAVIGSIHGNEPLGAETVREINQQPRDGVVQTIGHPAALALGQRMCGTNCEMGGLIPGDPDSDDPDVSAAGDLHCWLERNNPWGAVSIHENDGKTPGSEYISVGKYTRKSLLAVADLACFSTVNIQPKYPLHVHHPEVVEVEQIVSSTEQRSAAVRKWLDIIDTMAKLGPENLAARYNPYKLRFYIRGGSFMLTDRRSQPNEVILRHLEALEEATAGKNRYDPLVLRPDVAKDLGLAGLSLFVSSGNHQNMSKLLPEAGVSVADGTPRRQCLGGFFIMGGPPHETGVNDWLEFDVPELNPAHF